MRLKKLFLLDMRFQAKYGFYFLYAVLTVIYIAVLFALLENWKEKAAVILIFSDPASMGLFFMGAIVLLEKSQHTTCACKDREIYGSRHLHDCGRGRWRRCLQVGAFEILPGRTQWMGEPGLRKESVTEYRRTAEQPAAFQKVPAGCFCGSACFLLYACEMQRFCHQLHTV